MSVIGACGVNYKRKYLPYREKSLPYPRNWLRVNYNWAAPPNWFAYKKLEVTQPSQLDPVISWLNKTTATFSISTIKQRDNISRPRNGCPVHSYHDSRTGSVEYMQFCCTTQKTAGGAVRSSGPAKAPIWNQHSATNFCKPLLSRWYDMQATQSTGRVGSARFHWQWCFCIEGVHWGQHDGLLPMGKHQFTRTQWLIHILMIVAPPA